MPGNCTYTWPVPWLNWCSPWSTQWDAAIVWQQPVPWLPWQLLPLLGNYLGPSDAACVWPVLIMPPLLPKCCHCLATSQIILNTSMYQQHIAFPSLFHSGNLVPVCLCIKAFFPLSCIISCQTAMVYKDSPHSHQSSPEEDSSRSQNIEIKPLGSLLLKCSPRTRTAHSNDGHTSYVTEAPCFLAPQRWSSSAPRIRTWILFHRWMLKTEHN